MRTHNPDTPTARDWLLTAVAVPALLIVPPALAEAVAWVVAR